MECRREGRRAPERGAAVVRPDGVEGGHRLTQRLQRTLEVAVPRRLFAYGLDGVACSVLGQRERFIDHGPHGRVRRVRGSHGRREDASGLSSVGGLMGARDVQRLGVSTRRIGGVDRADRRHVHRGTAVDDVARARLARVGVTVVQPCDDPLLGEEDALQRQGLGFEFGDPARIPHQVGHEMRRRWRTRPSGRAPSRRPAPGRAS